MVARAAKDAMAPPGIPGVPTDRSTSVSYTHLDVYKRQEHFLKHAKILMHWLMWEMNLKETDMMRN